MNFTDEEYSAIIAEDQLAYTEHVFSVLKPNEKFMPNWHIDCIVEHLKAVENGDIKRLIINMPPRAGKSITTNIGWIPWLLGRNPHLEIISASYSGGIGDDLASKTRMVFDDPAYKMAFPELEFTKFTDDVIKTTKGGQRKQATVDKGITGIGADYIVIDDPINPRESLSETKRITANDWITGTLFSRINNWNDAKIVLVMQRLHDEDPTGVFLDQGGWHHLKIPAYFHEDITIECGDRKWKCEEGEYLHEGRLDENTIGEMRKSGMTEYQIAGQYMQNPAPIGGGEFKSQYLQYYNNYSKEFTAQGMNVYILVDAANAKKKKSDYTAMIVVGLAPDNNYYLLDAVRDRLNPTERIDMLIQLHMKWSDKCGKTPIVGYEQYGMMTDVFYLKKAQSQLNYRFPIVELGGTKMSKEDRIRRIIPMFENRRVYIPRNIIYTDINGDKIDVIDSLVEKEMLTFPVGKHDDMLDALSRIMDENLYAKFPKVQVRYLEAGKSYRDELVNGFEEDNFMSW